MAKPGKEIIKHYFRKLSSHYNIEPSITVMKQV